MNPIVPLDNRGGALSPHLSTKGVTYVLDQVLRIALHGRMQYGLERYRTEHPEVDILLLEPTRDDLRMFSYNIMRYSARRVVAAHAYRSVLQAFQVHEGEYRRPLRRHGIGLRDPPGSPSARGQSLWLARGPQPRPVARPLSSALAPPGGIKSIDDQRRRRVFPAARARAAAVPSARAARDGLVLAHRPSSSPPPWPAPTGAGRGARSPRWTARRAWPGLTAPVLVRRDALGVPHLQAASLPDLVRAQGYVTAQDRMWQMDLLRRRAQGELRGGFRAGRAGGRPGRSARSASAMPRAAAFPSCPLTCASSSTPTRTA